MTIGNIPGFGNMYGNYSMNRIPSVDASQVEKAPEKQQDPKRVAPAKEESLVDIPLVKPEPVERPSIKLEDVSLTFNREETFDYLGSESSLSSLDMDKAISDMKKDQILSDYSYFVGTAPTAVQTASEDGIVIAKQ